jgi:hypothetical protein
MGMACSTHGVKSNTYRVFVRKLLEKRPLGRPSENFLILYLKQSVNIYVLILGYRHSSSDSSYH